MDSQLLGRKCPSRKEGADRFKDDLMFGLAESVRAERLDEILPQVACDGLIAKRAKGLKLGCELCLAIHCDSAGEILSLTSGSGLREKILPDALHLVYSRCGSADEDSSDMLRIDPRKPFWSRLPPLLGVARARASCRVSLETGTTAAFAPARALYASAGFVPCGPFGGYQPSEDNLFMTLELGTVLAAGW